MDRPDPMRLSPMQRKYLRFPRLMHWIRRLDGTNYEPEMEHLEHDDVAWVDELEIEVRTLDQFDLRNVGFVKIDVEGHELAVLEGAARTLARERPNLLIEANEHHRPDAVGSIRRFMAELDYE